MNGRKIALGMLALSLAVTPAAFAATAAKPSSMQITLNGQKIKLSGYEIAGNNYFKLRDLAYALRETGSGFSVVFDGKNISLVSGEAYKPVGGELEAVTPTGNVTATQKNDVISINKQNVTLTGYEIDGYNYFKLRDMGEKLDFDVDYDDSTRTVILDTDDDDQDDLKPDLDDDKDDQNDDKDDQNDDKDDQNDDKDDQNDDKDDQNDDKDDQNDDKDDQNDDKDDQNDDKDDQNDDKDDQNDDKDDQNDD